MRQGKTGYKMSARAGCRSFGVNLCTAGDHIFMECKYECMVCMMKPPRINGPTLAPWHQQCDMLLGLVPSTSLLLAQPSQ